jgi:hypothetical protein
MKNRETLLDETIERLQQEILALKKTIKASENANNLRLAIDRLNHGRKAYEKTISGLQKVADENQKAAQLIIDSDHWKGSLVPSVRVMVGWLEVYETFFVQHGFDALQAQLEVVSAATEWLDGLGGDGKSTGSRRLREAVEDYERVDH